MERAGRLLFGCKEQTGILKLQWGQIIVQENNMPIVNSFYKSQKLFASEFFCPNCRTIRAYHLKPMSEEISLAPLPFKGVNEPSDVIECRTCGTAFDPDILLRSIQSLFKLAGTTRYQLDKGISPGFLKLQLISEGLNENFAEQLISLALQ
jgi:hypothetical protein